MLKLYVTLLVVTAGLCDYLNDDTSLEMVFLVHRHGDRTPVIGTLALTPDKEAVIEASAPYGFGQLTDFGKLRSYALGETIRYRYNDLLSPRYNASEIYIRSTDSTRTKMSVLAAMAAVYPGHTGSWNHKLNWEPVPYTTVPPKYDFNYAIENCPVVRQHMYASMAANTSGMARESKAISVIADLLGNEDMAHMGNLAYTFYDVFVSQLNLGVPTNERIVEVMPQLKKEAADAIDAVFGDEDYIALQAGVFLNEFFKYASKVMNGEDTPRVRVYSAHDINVYSLMAVAQVTPRPGVPPYSSSFTLELRKNGKGQYFVLAVYQPSPGEDLMLLPIKGCSTLYCEIEEFHSLVSKYLMDEGTWRTKCGFTFDMEVNTDNI